MTTELKLQGKLAEKVVADYNNGVSMRKLAQKYGAGAWAVRSAVQAAGAKLRPVGGRSRLFTEAEKKRMVRLYERGVPQMEIAEQMRTSQISVSRVLRAQGVDVRPAAARGERHGSWKGGRVRIGRYQAIYVERDDPMFCMAHSTGYVLEHRLVLARFLGRPLTAHETVHHINGNQDDNRIENLQLRTGRHGKGVVMTCRCCGSHDIECKEVA